MAITRTFDFTGALQTFQVPANISGAITVTLRGAGTAWSDNPQGGGIVSGTLDVSPGDVLNLYVGGPGVFPGFGKYQGGHGGWPDGGEGGDVAHANGFSGQGGAGSTSIRLNGTGLAQRVAVAGGAGGSGWEVPDTSNAPGAGGADTGDAGQNGGGGGTQSAGGAGGTPHGTATTSGHAGASGSGGDGGSVTGVGFNAGGGGGGGYFGGGGGGGADASHVGGAGGGGSNYTGGLATVTSDTRGLRLAFTPTTGQIVLSYSLAPNTPEPTAPDSGSNEAHALPIAVWWNFTDPDPDQDQARADVRWRVGSGAWTEIDDVAYTDLGNRIQFYYTFPAGTFAAFAGQQIEWQVRTYNSTPVPSGWSTSSFFKVWDQPAPFVYDSTPVIDTPSPEVSGARSDSGLIADYSIQVTADVAGAPGTILSTIVVQNQNPVTAIADTAANGEVDFVNGTSYHILTQVAYPTGVAQAAPTDSGAIVANINSPLAPTLTLTPFIATGSVQVAIANPAPDPNAPVYNRLYRTDTTSGVETLIADQVPLNSTHTDWTCGFNRSYRYRAEAVGADGGFSSSA